MVVRLGVPAFLVASLVLLSLVPLGLAEDPDITPPVIAPHALVDADASGFHGGAVAYAPPAWTDDVDGTGFATCAPASGSNFPVGSTNVTCSASDAAGNAATPTTFVVRVTLRGVGAVGGSQPSYALADAALDGVRVLYTLRTPDGHPLAGVNVTVKIIRQVQFVGFLDSAVFAGATDADGAFAFDPGAQFALPTGYLVLATPSHPLLVGGAAQGRYTVTPT